MNFNIADVANAFKFTPAAPAPAAAPVPPPPPVQEAQPPEDDLPADDESTHEDAPETASKPAPKMVDPLQLWGSLAQQFQQIAAGAIQQATAQSASDLSRTMAAGLAKGAPKAASAAGKKMAAKKVPAKKAVTRKPAIKKPAAKKAAAKKPAARAVTPGRWSGR
jgi:hypothetical protein